MGFLVEEFLPGREEKVLLYHVVQASCLPYTASYLLYVPVPLFIIKRPVSEADRHSLSNA
jgi:hypothetical protein